jgi:hypothetical protein
MDEGQGGLLSQALDSNPLTSSIERHNIILTRCSFNILGLMKYQTSCRPGCKQEGVADERPQSTEAVRPVASAGMNFSSKRVKNHC